MVIVIPKAFLFKQTAETGIKCLMETSHISAIIMNSVGLAFILSLDELIYTTLMSEDVQTIVELCEDYPLYDIRKSCVGDMTNMDDDSLLKSYASSQTCWSFGLKDLNMPLPIKLAGAVILSSILILMYYDNFCMMSASGRLVSIDMHLPNSVVYGWATAFLPNIFPHQEEEAAYWQMPKR